MTQISKRVLGKQMEVKVYETMWESVAKINKNEEANLFFTALFTKTERVNFAKRLSVAIMLYKGYDWREIRDFIKVSTATIAKFYPIVKSKGFELFMRKVEKEKRWRDFFDNLKKTYLIATHGYKVAQLENEGVERVYLKKGKKTLF